MIREVIPNKISVAEMRMHSFWYRFFNGWVASLGENHLPHIWSNATPSPLQIQQTTEMKKTTIIIICTYLTISKIIQTADLKAA